ncbi:MAG TPA: hypothetical protein VFW33_18620 [Gemmataceae bacterium]|nr:hypothetical protein [Gemmataceae bacterium]
MSTRSVGIACLALSFVLAALAVLNVLGGSGGSDSSQLLGRAAILMAPVIGLVSGLYLLRKTRTYY